MRSSSILDISRRSAPVVEAILAGEQRLRSDERRQKPAQNTDTNSPHYAFLAASAFTHTCSCSRNTQQQQLQQARGGAPASHRQRRRLFTSPFRFSDGEAITHSSINEHSLLSDWLKSLSIKYTRNMRE